MNNLTRFLLADDDTDDTSLFCEALHLVDANISCNIAENGKHVMEILKDDTAEKPQFIFLDLNMPVMTGWECLERLKKDQALAEIPVVIYSTSSNQLDMERAFALDAFCFITKPDHFKVLTSILGIFVKTSLAELPSRLRDYGNVTFNTGKCPN